MKRSYLLLLQDQFFSPLTLFGIQMAASQTRTANSYLGVSIPVGRKHAHTQIQKFHVSSIGTNFTFM
jgi:hypothetical protein